MCFWFDILYDFVYTINLIPCCFALLSSVLSCFLLFGFAALFCIDAIGAKGAKGAKGVRGATRVMDARSAKSAAHVDMFKNTLF